MHHCVTSQIKRLHIHSFVCRKLNDEKMITYRNFCASQENPCLRKSLLRDMQVSTVERPGTLRFILMRMYIRKYLKICPFFGKWQASSLLSFHVIMVTESCFSTNWSIIKNLNLSRSIQTGAILLHDVDSKRSSFLSLNIWPSSAVSSWCQSSVFSSLCKGQTFYGYYIGIKAVGVNNNWLWNYGI